MLVILVRRYDVQGVSNDFVCACDVAGPVDMFAVSRADSLVWCVSLHFSLIKKRYDYFI